LISYGPEGSDAALKPPSEAEVNCRNSPVSTLEIRILTPGITAPDASETDPEIVPVGACARQNPPLTRRHRTAGIRPKLDITVRTSPRKSASGTAQAHDRLSPDAPVSRVILHKHLRIRLM
jgi:hypothetical protein